jgi:hypothetical protein
MKLKYIKLFESEYWDRLKKLQALGLANPDVEKVEAWLEKKRQNPEDEWHAIDFSGLQLRELPDGPWQTRGYANFCHSELKSLPAGLEVGRHLFLTDMPNLTRLPDGLKVGGNLSVFRCPNLESLPSNLTVGGDLSIMDCPIRHLPNRFKVKGQISFMDSLIPREDLMALRQSRMGLKGKNDPKMFFSGHEGPTEGPRPQAQPAQN